MGPLNVASWLERLRAGELPPLTDSVQVSLDPKVAQRADELADRINVIIGEANATADVERSITEAKPDVDALIADLVAEHEALLAEHEASLVTLTFRARGEGDAQALAVKKRSSSDEVLVALTAQYSLDPKLTEDDVHALIPVIGWAQFDKVTDCWANLGQPPAPKSLTPSRSPATGKR